MCYDLCPARTYADSSTLSCTVCPYDCYSCDSTNCLSCNTATDFRVLSSSTSRCVPINGYFDNLTTVCVKCGSNCLQCVSASYCVNCEDGYYISGGVCAKCPEGCLTCISNSECQSCSAGLILAANFLCYAPCFPSQYFNVSTLSCQNCSKGCISCLSLSVCNFCRNGTYLLFNDSTPTCISCPSKCMTCLSFTNCTSCYPGFYFINNSCFSCSENQYLNPGLNCANQCPIRYYADSFFRICQPCPHDCYTCDSKGSCLTCNETADYREFDAQTSRCLPKAGFF